MCSSAGLFALNLTRSSCQALTYAYAGKRMITGGFFHDKLKDYQSTEHGRNSGL